MISLLTFADPKKTVVLNDKKNGVLTQNATSSNMGTSQKEVPLKIPGFLLKMEYK